jgi:hypothetical protein
MPPGAEGVASLVFDVPKNARGVRSGPFEGGEDDENRGEWNRRMTEPLFEIRCAVSVKLGMGFGRLVLYLYLSCCITVTDFSLSYSKDLSLEIPVQIVHPAALPEPEQPYPYPHPYTTPSPPMLALYADPVSPAPYIYPPLPLSPMPTTYIDHNADPTHVWPPSPFPNPHPLPNPHHLQPYQYPYSTPPLDPCQQYYFPSPPPLLRSTTLPLHPSSGRPLSAGPDTNVESSDNFHDYPRYPNPTPGSGTPQYLPSLAFDTRTGEPEEGKGRRAERVTRHLRQSSRHRSVSPLSHRFPVPAPITGMARLRNLPLPPIGARNLITSVPNPPNNALSVPDTHFPSAADVYSPRPVLSPKHSFSVDPVTHNSVGKSERVEALERMAAEVGQKTQDLSTGDIPNSSGIDDDGADTDADINKTLPPPPVPSGKENAKRNGRMHIDKYFPGDGVESEPEREIQSAHDALHSLPSDKTPPTPTLTAVTPARPQLHRPGTKNNHFLTGLDGTSESGLDALERRLLVEVGTRKLEKDPRPDVRTVLGAQPIAIPLSTRGKEAEPLNDSAISSLTLAGMGELDLDRQEHDGVEVEERFKFELRSDELDEKRGHDGVQMEERFKFELRNDELDEKHERDSDEKTHRAARSSVSGDEWAEVRRKRKEARRKRRCKDREGDVKSRPSSREEGDKERKHKRKDKEGEGECLGVRARKCAAAKGRVTAWLGQIEPVPPSEALPPLSPTISGDQDFPSPVASPLPLAEDTIQSIAKDIVDEAQGNVDDSVDAQKQRDVWSAPNPRSSGFVPIGTLKHDTFQRRPIAIAKDSSVVGDARRIADIWASSSTPSLVKTAKGTSSSPVLKDLFPAFPKLSPTAPTRQSIRTNRRVSPPSSSASTPILHTSGAITRVTNETEGRHHRKPLVPITKSAASPPRPLPKKLIQPSPRLPAFPPPPLDPEVKYDIRSARGGRGGRVATVAAIWASQQQNGFPRKTPDFLSAHKFARSPLLTNQINASSRSSSNSNTDSSSGTNLVELSAMNLTARTPVAKSSSVPAVISSSHATPMLSSTASLARPPFTSPSLPYKIRHAAKVPTAIVDGRSEGVGAGKTMAKAVGAKSTGELAFGQARLRDLIKKYQGTAA